jgi:hypothetical protein
VFLVLLVRRPCLDLAALVRSPVAPSMPPRSLIDAKACTQKAAKRQLISSFRPWPRSPSRSWCTRRSHWRRP